MDVSVDVDPTESAPKEEVPITKPAPIRIPREEED
jgi:hypothetical protein